MIVSVRYIKGQNSLKVISSVVVLVYIKNETFCLGIKFEIRKKDEIKIIADLNRVIISVNEYGNYKF